MILLSSMALALGVGGCVAPDSMSPMNSQDKADESSFDVIEINLGESLPGLFVERLSVDVDVASKEQINRSTAVFRLRLPAGQSASIAMRAEDAGLDSYLLVKDLQSGETIATCDDQAFIANTGEQDAVVSLPAEEERDLLIVATGGADMQTAGRFRIDSIVHSDPHVDLSATGPALRALTSRLREREPSVEKWFALGSLAESELGTLSAVVGALTGIPLQERAEFNGLIRTVNQEREQLFDEMIRRSGDDQASRDSVGRAVAAIYRVIRE